MDSVSNDNAGPHPWHFHVAIYFAVGFVVARVLLDRYIFTWLGMKLLTRGNGRLRMNKETRAKLVKCSESLWKLTYYAAAEAFILYIIYDEPWFRDTRLFFKGWPNQELKSPLRMYYMGQFGFYLYSIAALLRWETRRKDFSVMMSHHVITVILIGSSYVTSFFRIGSIVLALHDASDVFMETAKIFKYSGREFGASVFFGFFAISWLILRLIFFPFWVIRSSSYHIRQCLNLEDAYPTFLYYLFNTLLIMLLVFHIYWWILICAMVMRQLKNRGQVGEDIRSDSDDDE